MRDQGQIVKMHDSTVLDIKMEQVRVGMSSRMEIIFLLLHLQLALEPNLSTCRMFLILIVITIFKNSTIQPGAYF